ncbi:MAG: cellulase family glycosylhydrolase [Bacteroidales bacterium]|nr:cellulase family glycosylhydrolase [Bacteroidales bacterium]
MVKKLIASILSVTALALITGCRTGDRPVVPSERWTPEQATAWYESQGWLSGCNYIPASAINQIEMWSEDTYDHDQIEKEMEWARELGFKTMRVFLSSVVWNHDPEGLKKRMDDFLDICKDHGIKPFFVFFDDCWDPVSEYGPQREPVPGKHNSGWVKDPSKALRADTTALFANLESYVKDIVGTFRGDERVLMWDLYNEPGNGRFENESLPLLKNSFKWAREAGNTQPLTSGIWTTHLKVLNEAQLSLSDVTSYHGYGPSSVHTAAYDTLKLLGRPIFCTEYMARKFGGTFQDNMPVMKELGIAAINWGFVAGKTNTLFAWDDPRPDGKEPELWFHDIIRQDGTPFSEEEITCIKRMNGIPEQ